MTIPKIAHYGKYEKTSSGKANVTLLTMDRLRLYFSYKTPVAFYDAENKLVIRENDWGPTTGKHLAWINPDKSIRVPSEIFEAKLNEYMDYLRDRVISERTVTNF